MRTSLIVHERIARWTRRLRPRVEAWGDRIVESRSAEELAASAATACPVVVIDPAGSVRFALEALAAVTIAASQALVVVLDESMPPDFSDAAREAGATLILPSTTPLPVVLELLRRWLDLAGQRVSAEGWAADRREEPEPWELFLDDDDRVHLALLPTKSPIAR